MALADQFAPAEVLDSLAWMALPQAARIARASNHYLDSEKKIEGHSRRYDKPNVRTVTIFLRSLYTPPRGESKAIVELMLAEIERQREIRYARSKNRPYKWTQQLIADRRRALASATYGIYIKRNGADKRTRKDNDCAAIGRVGDTIMMVDRGSSYVGTLPRIYMRHIPTKTVKVVVLEEGPCSSIISALSCIAPENALRRAFTGSTISLDFHNEGFVVDGDFQPWRRVRRVYVGKDARWTPAAPAISKPVDDVS